MNSAVGSLLLVGASILIAALIGVAVVLGQRRLDGERDVLQLFFPNDLTLDQVIAPLRVAASLPAKLQAWHALAFEMQASDGQVVHLMSVPRRWRATLVGQLMAANPGLRLAETTETAFRPTIVREYVLSSGGFPLRSDFPAAAINSLLATMKLAKAGERIVLHVVAVPAGAGSAPSTGAAQTIPLPRGLATLRALWSPPKRGTESLKTQRDRVSEPQFRVVLRVGVQAAPERAGELLRAVVAGIGATRAPGTSWNARPLPFALAAARLAARRAPVAARSQIHARSLAVLLGWPIVGVTSQGLAVERSRRFAAAPKLPRNGLIVGDAITETSRPVGQRLQDRLTHGLMQGVTGSGKSTWIGGQVSQLMRLPERPAIVVIEPKGDLNHDLAGQVPPDRIDDVIWLDPASAYTMGLNPLAARSVAERELVVDGVYGILKSLSTGWGPRLGTLLEAALYTLSANPGYTMAELPVLLTNESLRRKLVGRLGDEAWAIKPAWASFEAMSPGDQATVTAPILSRARPWIQRSAVRQLIGVSEPRWSIDDVLNNGKILFVSLGAGTIGAETATLIGALLLDMIWRAIIARGAIASEQRRPAMILLDEWQTYSRLPVDLADALALARGYKAGFQLANQYPNQLPPELRSAAMSQTRSKVCFTVGAEDARLLAREMGDDVKPEDLSGLGRYEAVARLVVDNETQPPVSIRTRPLPEPTSDPATVQERSRELYGLDRAEVEAAIRARQEIDPPNGDLGRRPS